MKTHLTTSCVGLALVVAVLTASPARAQSTVAGNIYYDETFYQSYKFSVHYAAGRYWAAFPDGKSASPPTLASCYLGSPERIRVYTSANGTTWSEATNPLPFPSFCAEAAKWSVRFLGNVVIAFAQDDDSTIARYYSKGTLDSSGAITWQVRENLVFSGSANKRLTAAIVNGKPVLWGSASGSPGQVWIGSSLDSPTWTTVVNPTALNAFLGAAAGTSGDSLGATVFPLRSDDPNNLIVIRATSLTIPPAPPAGNQAQRLVSIKFDASTNTFDDRWFNVSTEGGRLAEDATTQVYVDDPGGGLSGPERGFAAAQQSDGIIHVVYVNQNGDVVHYRRSAGLTETDSGTDKFNGWKRLFVDVDGAGSAVSKVGLTVIDDNNLLLFYVRDTAPESLYYRRYDGRTWGAEKVIRQGPDVDINRLLGTMEKATGCNAGVAWNEGSIAAGDQVPPFNVYFRLVNPACTPPTYYFRSIGTAADDSTGSVSTTSTSAIVNGVGTSWLTINRGQGDVVSICDQAFPTCTSSTNYMVRSVQSDTQLTLATAYAGSTGAHGYTIRRQFKSAAGNAGPALIAWEDCIDGGPCTYFPPASNSLVADNRVEIGVLYKDSVFQPAPTSNGGVVIRGSATSGTHRIILTVAPGNRHNGTPAAAGCTTTCASAVYQGSTSGTTLLNDLRITDSNVTVEWLEFRGFHGLSTSGYQWGAIAIYGQSLTESAQNAVLDHLLIHDFSDADTTVQWEGVRGQNTCCKTASIRNSMIWDGDEMGISGDESGDSYWIENCTVDDIHGEATRYGVFTDASVLTVRNTISTRNTATRDFTKNGAGSFTLDSSNNTSSDSSAPPAAARTLANVANLYVNPGVDLHLKATAGLDAIDTGVNLSSSIDAIDIDGQVRPAGAGWDRGADEFGATTAVHLLSFDAASADGAVDLSWQTGSELDNLGFNLYRSSSDAGPWTRLTASLIPGLGSSPLGASYAWRDSGLVNGTRYFYLLEDVDSASRATSHGPVSAVPVAAPPPPHGPGGDGGGGDGEQSGDSEPDGGSCPAWVRTAYGSFLGSFAAAGLTCTRHGDPEAVSLGVVSRDSSSATLELRTGGFYALREPSGGTRVFVPGFDFPSDPRAPALPFRRALVDAVVGRRVHLDAVQALDPVGFPGLVPSSLGAPEMRVMRDGTVRPGRRAVGAPVPERFPAGPVRLLPSVFQGEAKSAVVEISPLRFDARSRQLLLARRIRVRLLFIGVEAGESGRGTVGRASRRLRAALGDVLARLYTTSLGLHAVAFEQLFPGNTRGFAASALRLERQGRPQAFHLEPPSSTFGPGSRLYFHADTAAGSTDFSSETAWELVRSPRGVGMPLLAAAPQGDAVSSPSAGRAFFETNRVYQPGLLDAPDPWLWEVLVSGATKTKSFSLTGLEAAASGTAELEVFLQGASESGNPVDHHVAVSVNGVPAGDAEFAGKKPYRMGVSVPVSLLREGANELSLTNVPDTGVSSYVFLDRFTVSFPQRSYLGGGVFEGTWNESGTVTLVYLTAPAALLDVTAGGDASWLTGYETTAGSLRFRAEAGHRYLAVSEPGLLAPRVVALAPFTPCSLRSSQNQADYILVAPRVFLAAAAPLLERRRDQGLQARAVALETIADEFGHAQPSAGAIKDFLAFAFHSWTRPSPRYVLLLGDSNYDPRNLAGSSPPSPLPALWTRTAYLWTVSDPELAAVNGEDPLPDLAIGRLPAGTVEEAGRLVDKLLAWEDSGQGLSGPVALVADNPDLGGDFDAEIDDIAGSFLQGRDVRRIRLGELGGGTRAAIREALDSGLSLLSYVGHGGSAVWASENVWNSWDAPSLRAQSRQPFLLTFNCLNGYFVAPAFDSLAESLLKVEGRGAIAAFSASGLSLDGPAHLYDRALVAELTGGRHERLGDALLAAQKAYAQTGLMPELLAVYHLLGDPAMPLR